MRQREKKRRKQTPAILRYVVFASVLVTSAPLFVVAIVGIHAMDSLWRTLAPRMSQTLIGLYAVAALITFTFVIREGLAAIRDRKLLRYQPRKTSKKGHLDSPGSGRVGTGSPFTFGGGDGGGGFGGGGASGSW